MLTNPYPNHDRNPPLPLTCAASVRMSFRSSSASAHAPSRSAPHKESASVATRSAEIQPDEPETLDEPETAAPHSPT